MTLEEREQYLEKSLCKYQLKPLLRNKAKDLVNAAIENQLLDIQDKFLEYSIAVDILAFMLFYKI